MMFSPKIRRIRRIVCDVYYRAFRRKRKEKNEALAGPENVKNGHTFAAAGACLKILDRILSCLLILGGMGHTIGSLQFYKSDQITLLWSLCASLFVFLFAAVSLIRAGRPQDTALAWVCLVAGLCWIAASLRFGVLIGNLLDFRPLIFGLLTLGLCAFCVRTLIVKR
jgi:hypothetical protein